MLLTFISSSGDSWVMAEKLAWLENRAAKSRSASRALRSLVLEIENFGRYRFTRLLGTSRQG